MKQKSVISIKEMFEAISKDGKFSHHMSNFAHCFLEDADISMIKDEPNWHTNIDQDNYVYAACFVHYWCDVLLMQVPDWVFSEGYKHSTSSYSYEELKKELERTTPIQFKLHNKYMSRMEVVYV